MLKFIRLTAAALLLLCTPLMAAELKLDAAQQDAANKLKAKGVSVLQIAADTEALAVNASLGGKQVADAELALIKLLPKVQQLNLAATSVTDAGLSNIAGFTDLTHLHLDRTAVTDAGLAHLKGLTALVYLNLYSTAVTDEGLKHLAGLKNLRRLYLWQTKVTDAGPAALKAAVPELYINRGEELAVVVATPKPDPKAASASAAKPINLTCPVSGKPVDAQFTLQHEGKTVGFCCNMCPKAFEKEPAKFASKIKADAPVEKKPEEKKPEEKKPEEKKPTVAAATGKPVNATCPVSGKPVDAEFAVLFDNKNVGFCCGNCKAAFEKEPAKFAAKIKADAAPAPKPEERKPEAKPEEKKPAAAPTAKAVNTKCPRTGQPVNAELTATHNNKTIAFCCETCQGKFKATPEKYLPKLVEDAK